MLASTGYDRSPFYDDDGRMTLPTSPGNTNWLLIFICWLIAMAALLGSLFFSEIMGLKPCVLCWYQENQKGQTRLKCVANKNDVRTQFSLIL